MSGDVWVGAVTTLAGGLLGGTISFILNRQQARESRRQRVADDVREQRRRSEDRRYAVYSDFLTRARSFQNAVEAYYTHHRKGSGLAEIDSLLQNANDAAALVFLVVEGREAYEGCRSVLRALSRARTLLERVDEDSAAPPREELDKLLGQAIREFQNAARDELGVSGPTVPWEPRTAEQQGVITVSGD